MLFVKGMVIGFLDVGVISCSCSGQDKERTTVLKD